MACKKCGKPSYSDLCYKCRAQQPKNNIDIVEVRNESDHIRWYKELLTNKNNQYTTSEIHAAFDLLWLDIKAKVHPQDKWKYNTASFSELLKMAWDMVDVQTIFYNHISKIKSEHVPGNGWELLNSLGFIKPVDKIEEVFF